MPDGKIINWRFPLKGLNTAAPYRNQQEGTSPDLANVRAFDIVEGEGDYRERRARGGQRGGYEILSAVTGDILDVVTLRSSEVTGGVYLCVATTDGMWIGSDPTNLTFYDDVEGVEHIRLIPYKGRLYVVTLPDIEIPEDPLQLPHITDPPEGAIPISDWNDLSSIWDDLDGVYKLENDMDWSTDGYDDYHSGETGALPIGDLGNENKFAGKFYGQGHTIAGLTIDRPTSSCNGLFGYTIGAEIYDLQLNEVDIKGYYSSGALAGLVQGGTVKNCHSSGSIKSEGWHAGGLMGHFGGGDTEAFPAIAQQCSSSCSVEAERVAGGLIGSLGSSESSWGKIEECFATGDIYALEFMAGGFIGGFFYETTNMTINNCYANGDAKAFKGRASGFCARMVYGTINNCYSTGHVSVVDGDSDLYGFGDGYQVNASNCFWDIETSGVTEDAMGAEYATTAGMQSLPNYTGWDIVNKDNYEPADPPPYKWYLEDGNDYPRLWWEDPDIVPVSHVVMGKVWDPGTDVWSLWRLRGGSAVRRPNAVTVYRQRIVLGGHIGNPRHWIMSRVDNPLDFDSGKTDASAAVRGSNIGETITALAPIKGDYLVVGCKTSIYIMIGDPMAGGTIETVSDSVGIYSSTAWCVDDRNNLYFTDGHDFYTFNAQEGLQNLSTNVVPRMFEGFPGGFEIDMTWDPVHHGVYIVQSYVDGVNDESRGWFVDMRTMGLFPDTYSGFFPLRTTFFDTEESDSRSRLEVADGNVIRQRDGITTDLGSSIDSYAVYPPLATAGTDLAIGLLSRLWIVLDENSGEVTVKITSGRTFQEVIDANPDREVTVSKVFSQIIRRKLRAPVIGIRIDGGDNPWAIEQLYGQTEFAGWQK